MNALLNIIVDVQEKHKMNGAKSFQKRFGKVARLRFDTSHTTTTPTALDSGHISATQLCTMMPLSITHSIQAHSLSKKSLSCLSIRGDNLFWTDPT